MHSFVNNAAWRLRQQHLASIRHEPVSVPWLSVRDTDAE